ncbi:MAG: phage holin family protein [Chthoniobacterales bacterium]
MAPNSGMPGEFAHRQPGLIESLQLILRAITEYASVRFELAGLESKAASQKVVAALIAVAVALMCLSSGFLYLSLSLIYVLAVKAGWGWGLALLASGVAMLLITVGGLLFAKKSLTGAWFPATIAELKKDSQWLKQSTTTTV